MTCFILTVLTVSLSMCYEYKTMGTFDCTVEVNEDEYDESKLNTLKIRFGN